jgi:hypothetical protein
MTVLEPYGVTQMFVKGEPYRQVKERARYMLGPIKSDVDTSVAGGANFLLAVEVIEKLIGYAPQQTLAALCEVLDPD